MEELCVKICEIDPYFYGHYGKNIKVDKNESNYVLFRIDVCFSEYNLAVENDEKAHTGRDLIFEEERQEVLEKNLIVNLLRLIQVKKVAMQIMNLLEYKHLLVNLTTDN